MTTAKVLPVEPLRFKNAQTCNQWLAEGRQASYTDKIEIDPAWIPDLDAADLLFLAHFSRQAARIIATSPQTPPRVLAILSRHADRTIQACVAANPATPIPILKIFARHYSRNIAAQAQLNPALPDPPAQIHRNAPARNDNFDELRRQRPWDEPYYRYDRTLDLLVRVTGVTTGQTWLDVGCSYLMFLKCVQDRFAVQATGLDDWNEADKGSMYQPRGAWVYHQRDLEFGFDLEEKPFDFISALEVLEHVIDTDHFLAECHRHLKVGGHLVLSTPNINCLRNRITTFLGIYPNSLEYRISNYHVRLYNRFHLASHLTERGFRVLAMHGVSFFPQRWLTWLPTRKLSERLADRWPQLCNNLVVIARKDS
ncbi:MAG: class I SAM-dependent methyltransferase [Magnetococcales bacterium]|nr:class I SAM-dependent methyltransferase [Magnetococcales bacterium]